MKIATLVRAYVPAPRPVDMVYAPIDIAVTIAEGLTRQGHEVTYFGPNGTHMAAKVETLNVRPLVHNVAEFGTMLNNFEFMSHNQPGLWDQFMVREMFERAHRGEFDLLHFHHPEVALPYAKLYPNVPVVYTVHDPVSTWWRETVEMYLTPNQFFISISNNQRIPAPDLPYIATIYNGINLDEYKPSGEEPSDYLLFTGRMLPDKGPREAIQIAQATGDQLLMIGPTYHNHQEYFDQYIKPQLDDKILYLGFMERSQLITYYQRAKALLFPIQWEEPFGLTMVEAMATGTPVVAMRRGSVPEVIKHGKTGIIAGSVGEMIEAVPKAAKLDRAAIRTHVEAHFSDQRMIDDYEAAFEKVLKVFSNRNQKL